MISNRFVFPYMKYSNGNHFRPWQSINCEIKICDKTQKFLVRRSLNKVSSAEHRTKRLSTSFLQRCAINCLKRKKLLLVDFIIFKMFANSFTLARSSFFTNSFTLTKRLLLLCVRALRQTLTKVEVEVHWPAQKPCLNPSGLGVSSRTCRGEKSFRRPEQIPSY